MDFLEIAEIFNIYKTNPEFVNDFLQIDLDYYKDLLPDDILFEYNQIQDYLNLEEKSTKQHTEVNAETETMK